MLYIYYMKFNSPNMKDFFTDLKKLDTHGKRVIALGGLMVVGSVIGAAINSVVVSNYYRYTTPARAVTTTTLSKWHNPNIKPFAESPYNGGEVYFDNKYGNQWMCEITDGGYTQCEKAEGKTEEELLDDRMKSEDYMNQSEAEEKAKNDYWCGAFEDPKKTGCRSL